MNLTIGCDPELFLFDNLQQRIVPAVGKIGGTKQRPLKLSKGTVQLDGTVVEIGTDPTSSGEEFVNNIQSVINEVQTKLDNRFHGRYSLRCGAMAAYSEKDISPKSPALEIGCDPQYTFEGEDKLVKVAGQDRLSIDAIPIGGHIHVGFGCNLPITDKRLTVSVARFVEKLYPSLPYTNTTQSRARTELMGGDKPLVRIKPYGFEIRNLDSYWLSSKDVTANMFNLLEQAAYELTVEASGWIQDYELSCVASAVAALPAKYQGTLPLDF
jgi:hypothetical protein